MRLRLLAIKRNHIYVLETGRKLRGQGVRDDKGSNEWLRGYVESSLSRVVNLIILGALWFTLEVLGVFTILNFVVLGLISTVIFSVLDYKFRWTSMK